MFAELGLDPRLLKAVEALGFTEPTGIQAEAIPPLVSGRDIIARARTGAGKTAAFGLPLLHRLREPAPGPRALVLAPTRELAVQVSQALESFAKQLDIDIVTVYGGAAYGPQLKALREKVPVVVGTPGRLIDHLERGNLDLSAVEMVVLDEADEMLRMGFLEEVERLLADTPATRQTALFSATMPPPIRRVAEQYLSDPLLVESDVEAGTTVDHITQRSVIIPHRFKTDALIRALRGEAAGAALVFCRTRVGCQETADKLQSAGIDAEALHGDLAQTAREAVLGRLRSGRLSVVVATDVAARGLDVEHITHVVNLDLPDNPETYTHRIGRTGRAGRAGTALTLATPAERGRLRWISRTLGVNFETYTLPTDAAIAQAGRARLLAELDGVGDGARAWLEHLVSEGAEPQDVAAAALELLARSRRVSLRRDLPDELPFWAQARPERPEPRSQRDRRPHEGGRDRQRGPESEVELFIGAGRRLGIRPGDLVGALANDTGISGREIGRIYIGERSSFVGMSKETAAKVLKARTTIQLRGQQVKMALGKPGGKLKGGGKGGYKGKGGPKGETKRRPDVRRRKP
ncbi:MAG: DEAD/DEAH box helicase [Bradymonadia bacterium]